jgi:hypothetical protein
VFAVQPTGTRQHLFRVETGESILDLHNACETSVAGCKSSPSEPPGRSFGGAAQCRVLWTCLAGLPTWRVHGARRQARPFPSR